MNMRTFCIKLPSQISEDVGNGTHRDLSSMLVQNLDEATHVGALKFVWQINRHFQDRHGVLLLVFAIKYNDWVPKSGHAYFVQRHLAAITPTLDVFHQFSSSPA
jgi:hypothetical protein